MQNTHFPGLFSWMTSMKSARFVRDKWKIIEYALKKFKQLSTKEIGDELYSTDIVENFLIENVKNMFNF